MQDYAEAVCAARDLGINGRYRLVQDVDRHGLERFAIGVDRDLFVFPPGTTFAQAESVFREAAQRYLEELN